MKRFIIIDDEEDARFIIKEMMRESFPSWKYCGEAASGQDALMLIDHNDPDLVFLDIKLQDMRGFDILDKTTYVDFYTIMVTAYGEYAVKAIDYNVTSYLLKPINAPDLIKAIKKVQHQMDLDDQIEPTTLKGKVCLHTHDAIHVVPENDIIRIESSGNYSTFYFTSGDRIVISKYLKEVESMVTKSKFIRVHNSHMINVLHLSAFLKTDGGYLLMSDKSKVPVSRRKKELLLNWLE